MSDSGNRNNYMGDRSSTRTHHAADSHHSKSSWSLGWGDDTSSQEKVSSNKFASGANMNSGNVISDRSTTRLHAPPGGRTSNIFGSEPDNGPVSSNRFASGANMNSGNVISERSTTRLHAPPGGRTSNIFGSDEPQGPVSSNRFASGANMNSGNVISERSTTRLHAPPGGRTSNIFGNEPDNAPVSSNRFASGANMNSGNVISERSTTRLHAPPGGQQSSNIFGNDRNDSYSRSSDSYQAPSRSNDSYQAPSRSNPVDYRSNAENFGSDNSRNVSANAFANGSNQNSCNVMTGRPTSRVLAPPGGSSNFTLG